MSAKRKKQLRIASFGFVCSVLIISTLTALSEQIELTKSNFWSFKHNSAPLSLTKTDRKHNTSKESWNLTRNKAKDHFDEAR